MIKKNDIVRLTVTALTNEGNGVGRYEGMAVFVPFTAVGDEIDCKILKVNKSVAYGKVEKLISSGDNRIVPDCPVYNKCGGCSFRHITYEAELEAKFGFVADCFKRLGGFNITLDPILPAKNETRYRNKAQLPVSDFEGKAKYGFFSPRSHRVIPFDDCLIQPNVFCQIADEVLAYHNRLGLKTYDEQSGRGLLRHIYIRMGHHSGEIMLTLVVTQNTSAYNALAEDLCTKYPQIKTVLLNVNPKNTNVILGEEEITLIGNGTINDTMCGNVISISSKSFYQVNTPAAEGVYQIAKEYADLKGNETLLDLYCGAGTVGISMADKVKKLIGVEIIPQAIENAKANAKANGVTNAEFICGDAGTVAQTLAKRGERPNVIVIDPPRKGCDNKTLDAIIEMSPERVVYISCNPATAARDCKYLCENGYTLKRIRPADMFPRTTHVETVCLLSKLNTKQHIEVDIHMDELDLTDAEKKATYGEIKDYVLEHTGLKVSSLYIAQVKQKCGIIERENYNKPKSEDAKQPQCPPDKEKAIKEALLHFGMI
ncbi:MAG: 23S rRNA (uracil(1939)-C(5))-methyltransferase RlmD [Oscillospiraceae bacterium]|nr:23S rRNA (uracil(1939)-C(5))-methyltransferase RlmD [Oscillospiraceae bacterium]